jgi:hypothetical protein
MKRILYLFAIIFTFSACDQEPEKYLPSSTGSPGHILIFMADNKWKYEPGDVIREAFDEDFEVLPQSEPKFDHSQLPPETFSKVMKRSRNILFIKISENVKKPEVLISYDKYASPQLMITVKAKNNNDFVDLFKEYSEKIVYSFEKAERDRLIKGYSGKFSNKKIIKTLEDRHNLSLVIPKGYILDVDSSDFAWISRETPRSSQGILIWHYNYNDTAQLHPENLVNKRDVITRKHVPGPVDGSYMITEKLIDPEFSEFMHNNAYSSKLKGLWKVTGAPGVFMGGPYVSFTTVDQKRNRIVTVDGYIYGGKKKKRELVRQVEAILYSLKII